MSHSLAGGVLVWRWLPWGWSCSVASGGRPRRSRSSIGPPGRCRRCSTLSRRSTRGPGISGSWYCAATWSWWPFWSPW